MVTHRHDILSVNGAELAYQIRGDGQLLLLIPGGDGGSDSYNAMAGQLSSYYRVVTYDRRGAYKSNLTQPVIEMDLETHSDDAHHLLMELSEDPALVFGSSAGALIGLDLALRYSLQVRKLIAHEPPVEGILVDFDQFQEEIHQAYQRKGGMVAMYKMAKQLDLNYNDLEPGVVLPQRDPRFSKPTDFGYTFLAVHHYRLDLAALKSSPVPFLLAGSRLGRQNPVYRCTAALAERLGKNLVEFPSHHAGYISHPRAFAARLHEVFESKEFFTV